MSPFFLASLAFMFLAVALLTGGVTWAVLDWQSPGRRRLREAPAGGPRAGAAAPGAGIALTNAPDTAAGRLARFVPKSPADMTKLRRRLVRAGYHGHTPAVVYAIAEVVTPFVVAVPVLLLMEWPLALMMAVVAAVVGFMLPGLVLGRLIDQRRLEVSNGLPDVLDLLVVCLEAGSSLDQAIVRATDELALAYPALGEELRMLSTETRAGKPRLEAFRNLEARTRNEDVKSLVAMLVQTDRFGTSLSQALRTFAEVMRTKRRQRAEEKAAKVGVKMMFPLVIFIFPALYVVLLGPAIIKIVNWLAEGA